MFDVDEPISDYQKVIRGTYLIIQVDRKKLSMLTYLYMGNLHIYFTQFRLTVS